MIVVSSGGLGLNGASEGGEENGGHTEGSQEDLPEGGREDCRPYDGASAAQGQINAYEIS